MQDSVIQDIVVLYSVHCWLTFLLCVLHPTQLLMEYIKGGSLDLQAFGSTPIPLDLLRQYTSDLLEALVYLHSRGVVHKNLQASSVFVDSHGNLRLADYSLCKR